MVWIIVMFLSDSHSDGTHSLQSIHYWDTNAMLHFYKSDEETNSSQMAWRWTVSLNAGRIEKWKRLCVWFSSLSVSAAHYLLSRWICRSVVSGFSSCQYGPPVTDILVLFHSFCFRISKNRLSITSPPSSCWVSRTAPTTSGSGRWWCSSTTPLTSCWRYDLKRWVTHSRSETMSHTTRKPQTLHIWWFHSCFQLKSQLFLGHHSHWPLRPVHTGMNFAHDIRRRLTPRD